MFPKYNPLSLEEEIKLSKQNYPFVRRDYLLKNKLICLGVEHTGNVLHPQFKEIESIFKKEKFSKIILEISKEQLEDYDKSKDKSKFKEKYFVIEFAKKKNIPLIAGDKDLKKILLENQNKYGDKNILLIRMLMYLNHKKNILEEFSKLLNHLMTEDEFKSIFLKFKDSNYNKDFKEILNEFLIKNNGKKINEITDKDNIFPNPLENKTELNNIIRNISYKRDEFMLKTILKKIKEGTLLFIAGKNHVIRQEPFLRKMEKNRNLKK